MIIKIQSGSNYLFHKIKNFKGKDNDYIIIKHTSKTFEHKHPDKNTCHFIWTLDKNKVREYIKYIPKYLNVASFVHPEFVDYYGYQHSELVKIIDDALDTYKQSTYSYYVPFFEYIKQYFSWDFPEEVIQEAYKIYTEVKKKA